MKLIAPRLVRLTFIACALCVPLLLDSCSSSSKKKAGSGVPSVLPSIDLQGSSATPPHSMARDEYPFDAGGNYMTAWAAEGEAKAGRGAATSSDFDEWKVSHHKDKSSSSSGKKSTKKTAPSSKTTSSGSKGKSSASTSSKKKTTPSRKVTVKKGDTLSSIARRYGTSVSKIKAANGLKSDTIRDGATLTIP